MHRSSDSVAALSAALAKAQGELVNPEKSLTAVIQTGRAGEGSRTFRYAPLSSGLDIVRKTLGRHEIATIQTTAVDKAAGMISLTTLLAHASGEWIASDWPVCTVADVATPQRMGAALTYARRYALFTLVGIAGEDDLDCPDLQANPGSLPGPPTEKIPLQAEQARHSPRGAKNGPVQGRRNGSSSVLGPDESAALRETLLAEVDQLRSSDSACSWAQAALTRKNRLNADDARVVEETFEQKLKELAGDSFSEPSPGGSAEPTGRIRHEEAPGGRQGGAEQPERVDKSVLTMGEPRRYRFPAHLRFVSQQPCLVCGRKPSDPHHLRFMQPRALGRKVSDEFAVPLCRGHHREVHRAGEEQPWWAKVGIDPVKVARALWEQTRLAQADPPVPNRIRHSQDGPKSAASAP
jgi:hypothetical protein